MKFLLLLSLTTPLFAQTSPLMNGKETEQLATRIVQLIESNAFAVPGLTQASATVSQNTSATFVALQRAPLNPALTYKFINEVKAFIALSDSIPRPYPFPAAAEQQAAELREDLQRMQRHFEAILQGQNQTAAARDADPNALKHYADADAKMLPPGKVPRVVFLGDSITELWRLNEYFTGRDFVNRGISGQNTTQMLARVRQDVWSLNPKAVIVLGGINDIGQGVALEQIEDNLTLIGDLAKAHGIHVAFSSLLPVSDYHKDVDPQYERTKTRPLASIQNLNRWIENHCRTEGFVYLNYYAVMVDAAGQMQADLSDDGLHPSAKGYRVMSPVALEAIGRALSDQPEDQTSKRRFHIMGK